MKTVGLLGTAVTMEQVFYKGRLQDKHGITVLVPGKSDREFVHRVIYRELCQGYLAPASRQEYLRIIKLLSDQGAAAVILGCTEIGLLVRQADTDVRLIDTCAVHADKAVEVALA
jgi:aspartate racemase